MCVTTADARLGRTAIAGWRYPARRTHCMIYGCEPASLAGPNAMILHIPLAAACTLTQASFIPMTGLRHVLDDMWQAAPKPPERVTRSFKSPARPGGSITTFDMGAFTWVAATRALPEEIHAALAGVRADRRAAISLPLIEFYARTWPHDALAIGCFSTTKGSATDPVCIEYPPQSWDVLRMTAVDAHGIIPRWDMPVTVNHRIIIGTDELGLGGTVRYREAAGMDPRLAEIVPRRVVAAELPGGVLHQGDFYADFSRFEDSAGSRSGGFYRAHGPQLDSSASRIPVLLG